MFYYQMIEREIAVVPNNQFKNTIGGQGIFRTIPCGKHSSSDQDRRL